MVSDDSRIANQRARQKEEDQEEQDHARDDCRIASPSRRNMGAPENQRDQRRHRIRDTGLPDEEGADDSNRSECKEQHPILSEAAKKEIHGQHGNAYEGNVGHVGE
jgi:hypothetical protein